MKKISSLILFFACLISTNLIQAQISEGGQPYSFTAKGLVANPPLVTMPAVNADSLKADDSRNHDKSGPWRFGWNHLVNLGIDNAGKWETLPDGDRIWRLTIECPSAMSVNLTFDRYRLAPGAKLWVYNTSKSYVLGAFTSKINQEDKMLGMDILPGDKITLEYYLPAAVKDRGELNLSMVTHGYKDVFGWAKAVSASGSCNYNVNCPQGIGWTDQINSVAIIVVGGSGACTGTMINDVPGTGKAWFLTANHCGSSGFGTWVFRWNYQSVYCSRDSVLLPYQSVSGSTRRANNAASDFTLLQLNSVPPASYNVFYAGWSRVDTFPRQSTGIHHPSGDIKKISKDIGPAINGTWAGTPANSHWTVDWDTGVTEPGSSGSGLFDQNKRIVGQLHGGASACGGADLTDEYGKFSLSWNNGTTSATRLRDWLDPCNTGVNFIDGTYYPVPPDSLDAGVTNISFPTETFCNDSNVAAQVTVRNYGYNTITSFTLRYRMDGGTLQTYNWTGTLTSCSPTTVITLPGIATTTGTHTFTAYTVSPNTRTDQDFPNDTLRTTFTIRIGSSASLRFRTDHAGSESSIVLYNTSTNDTIIKKTAGSLASDSLYQYSVCLSNSCFNLNVYDAGGNGICCSNGNGYFVLINGPDTLARGGTFTTSSLNNFCLTPTSSIDVGVNNRNVCLGDTILLSSLESNITSRRWVITGPGISRNDTTRNVTIIPASAGTVNVTLYGSGTYGSDTASYASFITINAPVSATLNPVICSNKSFRVGSRTYRTAGTYHDTLTASNGCDSLITTNLSTIPISTSSISATICTNETYLFGGRNLGSAGTYYDTLSAFNSCDSIVTLNLATKPVSRTTINHSMCSGDVYQVNSRSYSTAGTFYDTLTAVNTCDSILRINITVNARPTATFAITNASNATSLDGSIRVTSSTGTPPVTHHWSDLSVGDTLHDAMQGIYYDTVRAANGCDTVYRLTVGFNNGISDPGAGNVSVYPVPASDFLIVDASSWEKVDKIDMWNIIGEHIQPIILQRTGNKMTLNVSELPAAVYMLQIQGGGHTFTTRIVKK